MGNFENLQFAKLWGVRLRFTHSLLYVSPESGFGNQNYLTLSPIVLKLRAEPTEPAHAAAAVIGLAESERVSQTFTHAIGNPDSCIEVGVIHTYDVCLAPDFEIVDWDGRYQSVRNGKASVERDPNRANCAVLTLAYSVRGVAFLAIARAMAG